MHVLAHDTMSATSERGKKANHKVYLEPVRYKMKQNGK